MKKLNVLALTGAMVAAMSMTAFADDTEVIEFAAGTECPAKNVIDVTGYDSVTFAFDFTDSWGGGGVGYNSVKDSTGGEIPAPFEKATDTWIQAKYGNEELPENLTIDCADIMENENGTKTFELQCWWISPDAGYKVTVNKVKAEPAPATGDVAPVVYLAAIAAVAGIAMVASKKRA